MQAAAAVERQQLHAVADAQHRQAALQRGGQQAAVEVELARRDRIEDHVDGIRALGQEVAAARQQQAVDARGQRLRIALGRQQHRYAAGRLHRRGHRGADAQRGALAAAFVEARRNADERPHRAQYTFVRLAARAAEREAMAKVLIAGCGYVGSALGAALVADGDVVYGLRRRVVSLPAGVQPIEADLAVPKTLRDLPDGLDFVVYAASPGGPDDALYRTAYVEGLNRLLEALKNKRQNLRRVFLLSSTSVYGQSKGEWVDEASPCTPLDFRGRRILEAEALLGASDQGYTIVRLGGIYGPQRVRLIDMVRSGRATFPKGSARYHNRIHRDDCAGALRHLMRPAGPRHALPRRRLRAERRGQRAALAGRRARRAGAPRRQGRRRAGRGNKRCRNDRLLASGYAFRYPTFREGYAALLAKR